MDGRDNGDEDAQDDVLSQLIILLLQSHREFGCGCISMRHPGLARGRSYSALGS